MRRPAALSAPAAWTRRVAAAASLAASVACGDPSAPAAEPLPDGAVVLAPPVTYARWWQDVERCSLHAGSFARVHWYVVPDAPYFEEGGELYDAYWWRYDHRIVVAGAYLEDSLTVRHEMLHDLVGRGDHPAVYFQHACAGVVRCNEYCQSGG